MRIRPEIEETDSGHKSPARLIACLVLVIAVLICGMCAGFAQMRKTADAQAKEAYDAGYQAGNENVDVVRVETPGETQIVEVRQTITAETIRDGLKNVGELVTQEYNYTEVGTFESAHAADLFGHSVTLPWTKASYIYSYDGVIKAGIDFGQISLRKNDETMTIEVELPKARIISHEIVEDSFRLYDEKQNLFNPFSISDFDTSNAELKRSAERKALAKQLLEKADENAKDMVESFLRSGYDLNEYRIILSRK